MDKLRRWIWRLQIPMILLVPAWLIVGRGLLGSVGWISLILLITVVPVLLVVTTVQTVLVMVRKDVRSSHMVSALDAKLAVVYYVTMFLFGLFLVDGGDTEDSVASVASRLLGRGFVEASSVLAAALGILAIAALLGGLVCAIIELVRAKGRTVEPGNPATNKV
jgi:hypothetical protein